MIDLHCHVLPGIDDGPRSLEEAAEMCRMAAAAGCEALVATPHQRKGDWWNCDRAALAALRRELQEAVGPRPRILAGGEIRVDARLLAEILALPLPEANGGNGAADAAGEAAHGPLPLAGSRYLLLELGPEGGVEPAAELVHELSVAGWRPVVAHPEFIHWLAASPASVAQLMGLVHFVASDAHDLRRRPPGLRRAWETIAARWGEAAARELLADNPRAVVAGLPLPSQVAAEPAAGPRPLDPLEPLAASELPEGPREPALRLTR
jgi:protein-tyrosine phosphatase